MKDMIQGEKKNPFSLDSCPANKALENCLPKLGHSLQQMLLSPFRLCMAKEPHSSPKELPACSLEGCKRKEYVHNAVWGWDFLLNSIFKIGKAKLRNPFKVIRKHAPQNST